MSSTDIMLRYLKSREIADENAGLLASLIEADRGIDAVELDSKKLAETKNILEYSKLSYCLVNVDSHLLLLYPEEQRRLYKDIQPQLELGGKYTEITGFTYSEAVSARDLLQAGEIPYRMTTDSKGLVSFAVSEKYGDAVKSAADTVMREVEEFQEHFISRNLCWQNAVAQVSRAVEYEGTVFIGSEGGSSGIRTDSRGATVYAAKEESRFIPRHDADFNKKVLSAALNELNGYDAPVKAFYGEFADLMTSDMAQNRSGTVPMTKSEALDTLGLNEIPDINECADFYEELDSLNKKQETAFYTLLRMSMCRAQKLEDLTEHKSGRKAESLYQDAHEENIEEFAREAGIESNER